MPEKKTILLDILFTLLTFGLFNIWVQYRQMKDANKILNEKEFSFFLTFLFSFFTFGFFFIYHEYKMTYKLQRYIQSNDDPLIPILSALASFFCLWFLVDSYQQSLINEYIDKNTKRI